MIEEWYANPDPWGYKTNPDDKKRKRRILKALQPRWYKKALDVGCGEGWITKDLPADVIHGYEMSLTARKRIPKPVVAVHQPKGLYDLIVVTGVLYQQYDYQAVISMIFQHAKPDGTILTCHIKEWEQPLPMKADYIEEFPYREYTQVLRVFR